MNRELSERPRIEWPDRKRFAFTIFDDPDSQTLETSEIVYSFLAGLGFRTTKAVWPVQGTGTPSDDGLTCAHPDYLRWVVELQSRGFEPAFHNATSHSSTREETRQALDTFCRYFGSDPKSMANHYFCEEKIYWGPNRLSGLNRALYRLLMLGRETTSSYGHVEGHPLFWGDLCQTRVKYVRNFAFTELNVLNTCPDMPYHDPLRPYVNYWFACTEGSDVDRFIERLQEDNQDRLVEEGGCCILYTHFGHGFVDGGVLNPRFKALMERLSRNDGWFAPASEILDHLLAGRRQAVLTDGQRSRLERRWLWDKVRVGRTQ